MWPFDWHIYILPWLIINVNISNVNILQTVTDKTNIANATPTNRKSYIALQLAYLHLTLTHSKC